MKLRARAIDEAIGFVYFEEGTMPDVPCIEGSRDRPAGYQDKNGLDVYERDIIGWNDANGYHVKEVVYGEPIPDNDAGIGRVGDMYKNADLLGGNDD